MITTKKLLSVFIACFIAAASILPAFALTDNEIDALRGTKLYVYNWGEYISDGEDDTMDVNKEFEEKYGIEVIYDTYDNNEVMYTKLNSGGVSYDIVVPSDYMIERMIVEGMLDKINFDNIPNFKYIDGKYRNLDYDPTGEYSIPYTVGMVGLIYNKKMVKEEPTSWNALWDPEYAGKILMFNNPRDAFMIAQSLLGINYNTEVEGGWNAAANLLKEQRKVNPCYVNDEVFLKMEGNEAALAPYYVGDYLTMRDNNPDLGFVFPKEGTNFFVDAMCIPKNAKNKAAAELYINFILEPEVSTANAEYICYASPSTAVATNPDYCFYEEDHDLLYPEDGKFTTQVYTNLSPESLALMSALWEDVKSYNPGAGNEDVTTSTENSKEARTYFICIISFIVICALAVVYKEIRNAYRDKVK